MTLEIKDNNKDSSKKNYEHLFKWNNLLKFMYMQWRNICENMKWLQQKKMKHRNKSTMKPI